MKNREISFDGINPSLPNWEIQTGLTRRQRAMRVATIVGQSVALEWLDCPDGRSVEAMAKLAVGRLVGTFDHGFRSDLGMIARDAFNRVKDFQNNGG
ncbi:MAG: hypothetical protein WCV93_04780 [Candidatus Shapirobacteria bacterium]|jgi:hypothetical protein